MTLPWNTSSPFDNMVNTYAQAMQKPVVSNPYFWTGTVTANPNMSDDTYRNIASMSDADFNKLSHQEKIDFLAKKRMLNTPPTTPVIAYKGPDGGLYDTYGNGMSPNGTMVHDGVTVAPTVPTVDNLIATANKPRVANRVANKPQVTTPTTPTPTFNYGGSAPTYASSYNLNRDPNYQYSEAYAWRNNPAPTPAPTPWNNGWAKPNPRASSITNYYAGIGY